MSFSLNLALDLFMFAALMGCFECRKLVQFWVLISGWVSSNRTSKRRWNFVANNVTLLKCSRTFNGINECKDLNEMKSPEHGLYYELLKWIDLIMVEQHFIDGNKYKRLRLSFWHVRTKVDWFQFRFMKITEFLFFFIRKYMCVLVRACVCGLHFKHKCEWELRETVSIYPTKKK